MYVNKKVLSVAILGALMSTSAFAANLSAPTGAVPAYFAKEIIATPAAPVTLTTSASAATQLQWAISYNFSSNEVRYARLHCSDNIEFGATTVTSSGGATANIGAINGLGTNVLTFSVTSTGANIAAADVFSVVGDHDITGTDQNVNCSVGLYDQPSQAQVGGTAGLIQNASFTGAYLAFAPSYELVVGDVTTHTANVEANPSYSEFVSDSVTSTDEAFLSDYSMKFRVRAPSATQLATYGTNGVLITLPDLFAPTTKLLVDGDFSIAANAAAPLYTGGALNRVVFTGTGSANALTATRATFNIGNGGFNNEGVDLESRTAGTPTGMAIPTATYAATLKVVGAAPTVYAVTDISNVKIGEIVRNGTELQAPLAQVPAGWISRMVLTNTGGVARPYTIAVMGETGNVIGTSNLTGTVPANGTVVVELNDVLTSFTAAPRATLNVSVAGSTKQIQGLYQIVNPASGSISNHAMLRPGTN